jgi:hypothetical protein
MLGLRSMWINFQAVTLPIAFAAATTALGWSALFWGAAAVLGAGSRVVPSSPVAQAVTAGAPREK